MNDLMEVSENFVYRTIATSSPLYERYILREKLFTQQFCNIYNIRLNEMKSQLRNHAIKKWGNDTKIYSQLIDTESSQDDCIDKTAVVIGTIFKDLRLRPSVLTEYRESGLVPDSIENLHLNYFSEDDKVFLEDESGRITLEGLGSMKHTIVTGVTCAMKGTVQEGGSFKVEDTCFYYAPDTVPLSSPCISPNITPSSRFIVLVSGLELGSTPTEANSMPYELSLQLLADFIGGNLGGDDEVNLASRIVRLVVAGNSMATIDAQLLSNKHLNAKEQNEVCSPAKQLDTFLCQILSSCPVDLIPGCKDPTNNSLPQQPLNPVLLPNSYRYNTFTATTNPYECMFNREIENGDNSSSEHIVLVGHSGEPVDDIARQTRTSEGEDCRQAAIDILGDTLKWGHVCPTAPDTVPCYPFDKTDPFIIKNKPSIMFAGNQDKYETRLLSIAGSKTLLVSIPKFSVSREAVLVNLETLESHVMRF